MNIDSLTLIGFRGIKNLSLNFHKQLTVVVGNNGAGKSTILDALAILLSWVVARIRSSGSSGRNIQELDIYCHAIFACLNIKTDGIGEWLLVKSKKSSIDKRMTNFETLKEFIEIETSNKIKIKSTEKSFLQAVSDYAKTVREIIGTNDGYCSIPLFVYYPINRAVLDIPLRIRKSHEFSLLEAYDNALTSGAANFRSFFEWFRNREDLENENKRDSTDNFVDKQLQAVRAALECFLPEFKHFKVKRNPLRMVAIKHEREIRIEQLSDGEKCLIAMIGDLARRLAIANPTLENPLFGEGIVLIDEIELHLHPTWQRSFVGNLIRTFPNCQFVLSTHSPQVLGEVKGESIRVLFRDENSNIQCHTPDQALGLDSVEILEVIMGTSARNKEITEKLHQIFVLIDEDKFEEAKQSIRILKEKLNGSIPEIVRAESLITMLEPSEEDNHD